MNNGGGGTNFSSRGGGVQQVNGVGTNFSSRCGGYQLFIKGWWWVGTNFSSGVGGITAPKYVK